MGAWLKCEALSSNPSTTKKETLAGYGIVIFMPYINLCVYVENKINKRKVSLGQDGVIEWNSSASLLLHTNTEQLFTQEELRKSWWVAQ
jgi:hypothetical protein